MEDKAPWGPTAVDLTNCTRWSKHTRSTIQIFNPVTNQWQEWLVFGEVTIRKEDPFRGCLGMVGARCTAGVTDFEHDSAWAFHIPIMGIQYEQACEYSCVHVFASIPIDVADRNTYDDLRVPLGPYEPGNLEGARLCKDRHCPRREEGEKGGHVIVPEGYYAGPPADRSLSRMVAGRRIQITIGLRPLGLEDDE